MTNDIEDKTTESMAELMARARRLLDRAEQQIALIANPVAGTCAIFHDDEVFQVALPWAGFEPYQFKIASRHAVPDPVVFTQLFDLVPSIAGRALLDVGAYTGLQGLVLRRFLNPATVYMVEPQNIVREPLARTIEANPDGAPIHVLTHIIGENGARMGRSMTRGDRTSETSYLRKTEGKLESRSIDSLDIGDIGFINLDIPGPKIYALRGAAETLSSQRPVVLTNLAGRDVAEISDYMNECNYEFVRVGDNSALFLPK